MEFYCTNKADIGGKEAKTELEDQDLETTKMTIKEKMKDMCKVDELEPAECVQP